MDAWAGLIDVECYLLLNDPSDAKLKVKIEKEVQYVNSHFPDSWQKKYIQGQYTYRLLHQFDQAITLFLEVLQEDPENVLVNNSLSGIYRRQLKHSLALQYAKKAIDLGPSHIGNWLNLAVVLRAMGDARNSMKACLKYWELSSKGPGMAEIVFEAAIDTNFPLDQLPDELKRDGGSAFTFAKLKVSRNWKEVRRLSLEEKNYLGAAGAYWMLGKKDSARYWSGIGLKKDSGNLVLKVMSAPDLQHALTKIDNAYREKIESGDDTEAIGLKNVWEINAFILYGQYAQATEKLIKMNNDLPNFNRYEGLNHPEFDQIKKEYPPFQEALNNLKRKPMMDVTKRIKL